MGRHLIRLASAPFISSCLATFGWVRFPCVTRGKCNAEFTKGGWEHWSYFKPFVNQSSHIFWDDFVFPNALFWLCHLSFRRYWPLSLEVVEKRRKCKSFWPPIFVGRTAASFLRHFVRTTYYPLLGKVRLSLLVSVCEAWQWSRMQNLRMVGKNSGRVLSRLWTKIHEIWRRCRRPLVVVNALDRLSILVSFRRYRPSKLPLSCEVGPKRWFWGPRFVGGRNSSNFGHAFSNYTYFRPCGQFWLSSVRRARRLGGEKKKKKRKKEHTMPGGLITITIRPTIAFSCL